MDFIMRLPVFINWKSEIYDSILVIINWYTKMVYYKPVKVTIDASSLIKIIFDMVVCYYGLSNSIITNWGSIFILKFWSSLFYFLEIKQRLSTTFHLQINSQIKRQNSIIEVYFQAFVNFEQNNWTRLLLMAEFIYNNAKMRVPVIYLSNSTVATISTFFIKKMFIQDLSQN